MMSKGDVDANVQTSEVPVSAVQSPLVSETTGEAADLSQVQIGGMEQDATRTQNPYSAVAKALRSGELVRQPCVKCGSIIDIEAHHTDYGQPLQVTWLCRVCHRQEHSRLRKSGVEPLNKQDVTSTVLHVRLPEELVPLVRSAAEAESRTVVNFVLVSLKEALDRRKERP